MKEKDVCRRLSFLTIGDKFDGFSDGHDDACPGVIVEWGWCCLDNKFFFFRHVLFQNRFPTART